MGRIACTDMAKAIGDKGKVLSLQGAFASINGRERSEGFHDCMTKEHPNIELIERPTDWDATKQAAALQTVLAAEPGSQGHLPAVRLRAVADAERPQAGRAKTPRSASPATSTTSASTPARSRSRWFASGVPRRGDFAAARRLRQVRRPIPARRASPARNSSSARPITAARSSSSTATRWIFSRPCW